MLLIGFRQYKTRQEVALVLLASEKEFLAGYDVQRNEYFAGYVDDADFVADTLYRVSDTRPCALRSIPAVFAGIEREVKQDFFLLHHKHTQQVFVQNCWIRNQGDARFIASVILNWC